jgi:hypothetical protein
MKYNGTPNIAECEMSKKECCSFLDRWLWKAGITRSLLITLALLPFSSAGVVWIKNVIVQVWTLIADKMA